MNFVVITSVIRNPMQSPYRTSEARLAETLHTIETVKNKIPNCYIVLVEGGPKNQEDYNMLVDQCNEIHYYNVQGLHRSLGELTLLNSYFNSDAFQSKYESLSSLSKISGRYLLNANFLFEEEKNSIKKDDVCWSGKGACSTRYWRVKKEDIKETIKKLSFIEEEKFGNCIDIEHAFYEYNVVPFTDIEDGKHVGITGFVSPMGIWEDA